MLFLTSSPALRLEIPTECCVDLQQLFGGFLLQRDCPGEKAWFLPRRTPAVGSLTRFEPQPGTPPGLMFSQQALLPACPAVGCLGCRQQRHYRTAPPSALSFSALNGGACRAPGQTQIKEVPPNYIRDPAFRRVVIEAYDFRCSATGWRIILPDSRVMVEAAHIVPFAESQNDDPRNGLALTPSFHWALDAGAIAPGPDFKWHVSKQIDRRFPE